MAKFGEEIRCILADVAQFLHVTLKNVSLPPGAKSHRQELIGKLENLQETYPQLYWELDEQPEESYQDFKPPVEEQNLQKANDAVVNKNNVVRDVKPSSAGNNGQQSLPLLVSPDDLTAPAMCGFLNRKTQSFLIPRNRKLWCVVKNGIFYAFEKQTSKSQLLSFPLQGTEARMLPPSNSKNEYFFELTQGSNKYTFSVGNQMEMKGWISALSREAQTVPEERLSVVYTSPDYVDENSTAAATKTNNGCSQPPCEILYEETNIIKTAAQSAAPEVQGGTPPVPSPRRDAAPLPKVEHKPSTAADGGVSDVQPSVTVPPPGSAVTPRPQPELPETANDSVGVYDEIPSPLAVRAVPPPPAAVTPSSLATNGSAPPLPSPRHQTQPPVPDVADSVKNTSSESSVMEKPDRTGGARTGLTVAPPTTISHHPEGTTSTTASPSPGLPPQRTHKSPRHPEPKAADSGTEKRDVIPSASAPQNREDEATTKGPSTDPPAEEQPPVKKASVRKPKLPAPAPAAKKVSGENLYVACWDCTADAENELTFKKGDLLVVISREYESLGWWIAQLTDGDGVRVVGLVPKDYLAKQY